jgi:acyl-CoA reductase-like NAD-dependent aldehyde dehydrogenase
VSVESLVLIDSEERLQSLIIGIPVIVFVEAETIDELVELANASEYSMVSSLWTRDVNLALDVASRIRSGCCNGRHYHLYSFCWRYS